MFSGRAIKTGGPYGSIICHMGLFCKIIGFFQYFLLITQVCGLPPPSRVVPFLGHFPGSGLPLFAIFVTRFPHQVHIYSIFLGPIIQKPPQNLIINGFDQQAPLHLFYQNSQVYPPVKLISAVFQAVPDTCYHIP